VSIPVVCDVCAHLLLWLVWLWELLVSASCAMMSAVMFFVASRMIADVVVVVVRIVA
jgi:hypothetical protein